MNKADLAERLSQETGLKKKDSNLYVEILLDAMKDALSQGDKVTLTGFGSLEVKERKAHAGFNPATGAKIEIPAVKTVCFKPGKDLKEKL